LVGRKTLTIRAPKPTTTATSFPVSPDYGRSQVDFRHLRLELGAEEQWIRKRSAQNRAQRGFDQCNGQWRCQKPGDFGAFAESDRCHFAVCNAGRHGTITLTNNSAASAAAPIQVVESAFGILTLNRDAGLAPVFDVNSHLLGVTSAANPVTPLRFGGRSGPVTGDESVAQLQIDLSLPIEVDIGGIAAKVFYMGGRSIPDSIRSR
jgi:hypothetical protein